MNGFRLGMTAVAMALTGMPATLRAADEALAEAATMAIQPGEFRWNGADTGRGPIRIVIDIPTQRLYVYRAAALIGVSAVSTGSAGHETPVGVFKILQKQVKHRSSLYDNAPMPYMQRLTWDGVALHGGHNPGYPDSHGCVRLPTAFAKKLFAMTRLGAKVVVRDEVAAIETPAAPAGEPGLEPPTPVEPAPLDPAPVPDIAPAPVPAQLTPAVAAR